MIWSLQGELKWTRYFEGQSFANNCTSGASYPVTCSLAVEDDPLTAAEVGNDTSAAAASCLRHGVVDSCPVVEEFDDDVQGKLVHAL